MRQRLKDLSREKLQKIILEMADFLEEEQLQKLKTIIDKCTAESSNLDRTPMAVRMRRNYSLYRGNWRLEIFIAWGRTITLTNKEIKMKFLHHYGSKCKAAYSFGV